MAHVAAKEPDDHADRVPFIEELERPIDFGVEVVVVDARRQLHIFDFRGRLAGTPRAMLLTLLPLKVVLEAPVVHDLAHGRHRLRGDLDKVHLFLGSELARLKRRHDAEVLFSALVVLDDDSDFRDPDALIDAVRLVDGQDRTRTTTATHERGRSGHRSGTGRTWSGKSTGTWATESSGTRASETTRSRWTARTGDRRSSRDTRCAGGPRRTARYPVTFRAPGRPAGGATLRSTTEALLGKEGLLACGEDKCLPAVDARDVLVLVRQLIDS